MSARILLPTDFAATDSIVCEAVASKAALVAAREILITHDSTSSIYTGPLSRLANKSFVLMPGALQR